MKKILTALFLTLGITLISGCSLTEQKPVDNSAMTEQITALQQQISGINTQLETIKIENELLKGENETMKENVLSTSSVNKILERNEALKQEVEKYKNALLQEKLKKNQTNNETKIPSTTISDTKQQTSLENNWKTYTNNDRNYSVNYPSELNIDIDDLDKINIGNESIPIINITIYKSKPNTDFQSFVQEKLINDFGGILQANEIEWITINNDYTKIGVKFPNKVGGYDGELYWVYIGHNNKVYRISVLTDYDDMTQKEFQDKIMSSFKFLD